MKILNIFWAIVIFSLVVIIHEFGHYFFARKGGIKVNEFSLGMGPRLFSFDAAGTKWSVKLLPIGGSCMMEGEDEASDDEGAFANKSVWVRFWTVFGGPLFNFILAFVLSLFVIGAVGVDKSSIVSVISGYPAQQAGLRAGDVITKINGSHINLGREVSSYFVFHPLSDKDVTVEVKRGSEKLSFDVKPQKKERFYLGFTYSAGDGEARIDSVTDDGSLKEAGAKSGDVITAVNGTEIKSGTELSNYFNASPLDGKEVKLTLKKADTGNTEEITVTPKSAGSSYTLGLVSNTAREKVGIVGTLYYSLNETKYVVATTVETLKMIVTGRVKAKEIAGPVGIVNMIGNSYEQSKSEGIMVVLLSMASISILISANLGVMNLLPIPALDGGRLVFLIIEAVRGKPVDPDKEGRVHFVGFVLLMLLMVVVLFNDILRIIG